MLDRVRRLCEFISPRCPALLVAVGVLLALPSLTVGLQLDDYFIRECVLGDRPWGEASSGPMQPFCFLDGNPENAQKLVDRGIMPWWTNPECRIRFMRPLTAITHIVDYRLWPNHVWLMHVQSLAWFGLLIWMAAVAYRRIIGEAAPVWVAVLAGLMFTLDDSHGSPVGWLANRNTLLAAVFGIMAIVAYDRWRRDGWRPGAIAAPLLLLAALLCKELAVCAGAYLLSHALFIDRGTLKRRLMALIPCTLVGVGWYVAYRALNYGVYGSAVYLDPGSAPLAYAQSFLFRAPLFLLGGFALPDSTLSMMLSTKAFCVHWAVAVAFVGLLCVLFLPLVRRDASARFWAAGMLLSLVPACAVLPADRLLMYVGFGSMGLLAQFIHGLQAEASWLPKSLAWRKVARISGGLFVVIHLIIAPLALPISSTQMIFMGKAIEPFVATMPDDDKIARQTVVLVNSSSWLFDAGMVATLNYRGRPLPERFMNLAGASRHTVLTRVDERTLIVRPEVGYLAPHGTLPDPAPAFSAFYALQVADELLADSKHKPELGTTYELPAATIEITDLTADGRPAEATLRFKVPLEDESLRWLECTKEGYREFTPPAIGKSAIVHSTLLPQEDR